METVSLAALDHAAASVGDRWMLLILAALLDGSRRYGELQERIGSISTSALAQRLASLEAEGLVLAEPYSRRPMRVRYALTADGRALSDALLALSAWGADRYGEGEEIGPTHAACGSRLEIRWHCPTCDIEVGEPGGATGEIAEAATFTA
jgi:DNA-binding HxlR family transcriptional regulator